MTHTTGFGTRQPMPRIRESGTGVDIQCGWVMQMRADAGRSLLPWFRAGGVVAGELVVQTRGLVKRFREVPAAEVSQPGDGADLDPPRAGQVGQQFVTVRGPQPDAFFDPGHCPGTGDMRPGTPGGQRFQRLQDRQLDQPGAAAITHRLVLLWLRRREVFNKSHSHQARSTRRLAIEAVYQL